MFAPWCPTCGHAVLLGPRSIVAVERTELGPAVALRCHCGEVLLWSASAEPPVQAAESAIPAGV